MAKLSKSSTAPMGPVHYTLGMYEFDLKDGNDSYETSDSLLISAASLVPGLKVSVDTPPADPNTPVVDMLDPHQNPSADHLSIWASDSAVAAAAANDAAIKVVAGDSAVSSTPGPSITEVLQNMLTASGSDSTAATADVTPVSPTPDPTPASPPAATAPDTTETK